MVKIGAGTRRHQRGRGFMLQFMIAGFLMAVGLCIAGAATHFYQGVFKQQAMLRYDGRTIWPAPGIW